MQKLLPIKKMCIQSYNMSERSQLNQSVVEHYDLKPTEMIKQTRPSTTLNQYHNI